MHAKTHLTLTLLLVALHAAAGTATATDTAQNVAGCRSFTAEHGEGASCDGDARIVHLFASTDPATPHVFLLDDAGCTVDGAPCDGPQDSAVRGVLAASTSDLNRFDAGGRSIAVAAADPCLPDAWADPCSDRCAVSHGFPCEAGGACWADVGLCVAAGCLPIPGICITDCLLTGEPCFTAGASPRCIVWVGECLLYARQLECYLDPACQWVDCPGCAAVRVDGLRLRPAADDMAPDAHLVSTRATDAHTLVTFGAL